MELDTNKTYAREREREVTDWNKELDTPFENLMRWKELMHLASSWVTCACGNQCAIIPRGGLGMPLDDTLSDFGFNFYDNVEDIVGHIQSNNEKEFKKSVKAAKKTLTKIEKRSITLINQILRKSKQLK